MRCAREVNYFRYYKRLGRIVKLATSYVIMDTTARPVDRYLGVSRLLRPRPFPLDLLVKTPEEIAQALAGGDTFVHEITTRGRVLYERTD